MPKPPLPEDAKLGEEWYVENPSGLGIALDMSSLDSPSAFFMSLSMNFDPDVAPKVYPPSSLLSSSQSSPVSGEPFPYYSNIFVQTN